MESNQSKPFSQKPPTGYTYDVATKSMKPSFDSVSIEDINVLSERRLSICRNCELFTNKQACSFCGCGMAYKVTLIYPLDEDGKAFHQVNNLGNYTYVCHLKKW